MLDVHCNVCDLGPLSSLFENICAVKYSVPIDVKSIDDLPFLISQTLESPKKQELWRKP